ncbi:hypothetical protein ABFS83_13G052000 [Erythranthe nasuta]
MKITKLSIDRLSDLPDSILCHILSFLPTTKNTVATCILARRWRYLWSYVPNLIFDSDDENIDRVLLLHKLQCVDTFRFTVIDCNDHQLETRIKFAVDRNVKNLHINFYRQNSIRALPGCLFTCKTLVDLRLWNFSTFLSSCIFSVSCAVVCLPRLKILHLHYMNGGYESLPDLLSGCPVLEELEIQLYCCFCSCKISSPTIKRLVINYFDVEPSYEHKGYYNLEINTPGLVYLKLVDISNQHIKSGPLTSLIEAYIRFEDYVDGDYLYSRSVTEFIDRIRNIRCLDLNLSECTETTQSVFLARTISFCNLIKLELTADCCFLQKMLECADNLEILILREEKIRGWMEPQQVPTCLSSRLRNIKFVPFLHRKRRFKAVRYVLKNAKVLEKIEIVYPHYLDSKSRNALIQIMSSFQRGSSACELVACPEFG